MTQSVITGALGSLLLFLVILSVKRANWKCIHHLQKALTFLAILTPLLGTLAFSQATLTKQEIAENISKDFIEKAREELARENPTKLYIPKPLEEGQDTLTKESAISSLTKLLNDTSKGESKEAIQKRIDNIDTDNSKLTENIEQSVIDRLYLKDTLETDSMVTNTVMALLSLSASLPESQIEPTPVVDLETIVLDESRQTAYIPLDIYLGQFGGIYFEMVYDNGTWKLNPYSLMRFFQLGNLIDDNEKGATE